MLLIRTINSTYQLFLRANDHFALRASVLVITLMRAVVDELYFKIRKRR